MSWFSHFNIQGQYKYKQQNINLIFNEYGANNKHVNDKRNHTDKYIVTIIAKIIPSISSIFI